MAENKIYAVLTDRGAQLEAAALASGVPVVLNKFVIGDANGNDDVTPDPARTALVHETYAGILNPQKIAVTRLFLRYTYHRKLAVILSVRWEY